MAGVTCACGKRYTVPDGETRRFKCAACGRIVEPIAVVERGAFVPNPVSQIEDLAREVAGLHRSLRRWQFATLAFGLTGGLFVLMALTFLAIRPPRLPDLRHETVTCLRLVAGTVVTQDVSLFDDQAKIRATLLASDRGGPALRMTAADGGEALKIAVDGRGTASVKLGETRTGGQLALVAGSGAFPVVSLIDGEGHSRLELGVGGEPSTAGLTLYDRNGEARVDIEAAADTFAHLSIGGPGGEGFIRLGYEAEPLTDGGHVIRPVYEIRDRDGKNWSGLDSAGRLPFRLPR